MKGGNTLTNTGYGKSCCRVLGKLGTQYFTPSDLVFTTQEGMTTLPPSLCRQKRNTASLGPDNPRSRRRECLLHMQASDPSPDMVISALRILQCYCLIGPHHQTCWGLRADKENPQCLNITSHQHRKCSETQTIICERQRVFMLTRLSFQYSIANILLHC